MLLDRACRAQLLAMAAGPVRTWSDPAEVRRKADECWPAGLEVGWRYLVRRAARPGPSPADEDYK